MKIYMNFASLDEMLTIPGIGEARANAILKARQDYGLLTKELVTEVLNYRLPSDIWDMMDFAPVKPKEKTPQGSRGLQEGTQEENDEFSEEDDRGRSKSWGRKESPVWTSSRPTKGSPVREEQQTRETSPVRARFRRNTSGSPVRSLYGESDVEDYLKGETRDLLTQAQGVLEQVAKVREEMGSKHESTINLPKVPWTPKRPHLAAQQKKSDGAVCASNYYHEPATPTRDGRGEGDFNLVGRLDQLKKPILTDASARMSRSQEECQDLPVRDFQAFSTKDEHHRSAKEVTVHESKDLPVRDVQDGIFKGGRRIKTERPEWTMGSESRVSKSREYRSEGSPEDYRRGRRELQKRGQSSRQLQSPEHFRRSNPERHHISQFPDSYGIYRSSRSKATTDRYRNRCISPDSSVSRSPSPDRRKSSRRQYDESPIRSYRDHDERRRHPGRHYRRDHYRSPVRRSCYEDSYSSSSDDEHGDPNQMPKGLRYDGRTSWMSFRQKFESFRRVNHWTDGECRDYLNWSLEGKAADFFTMTTQMGRHRSFRSIMKKLESRFGANELPEISRAKFHQAIQKPDEGLDDWADRVLTLATTAFKGLPEFHGRSEAIDRFCQGCLDKEAGKQACFKRPTSMQEAVDIVRHYQYISQAVDRKPARARTDAFVNAVQTEDHHLEDLTKSLKAFKERDTSQKASTEKRLEVLERALESISTQLEKNMSVLVRNRITCYYCKKPGHMKKDCYKYKQKLEKKGDQDPLN